MAPMRFVVMKGMCGWGDRLQCLLQVIRYAKITDRWLVCDWRDSEWAVPSGPSLDGYIDIHGIRHFRLNEFLAYISAYDSELSVTPVGWRHRVDRIPERNFLYRPIYSFDGGQEEIQRICAHDRPDFNEDIVIYAGVGKRTFNYSDFVNVHPARWVRDRLSFFAKELKLSKKGYRVVHLRGGSKKWAGGSAGGVASLEEKIEKKFPTLQSYIHHMKAEHLKTAEDLSNLPTLVLSDSAWLAQQWFEHGGDGHRVPQSYNGPMMGTGIHEAGFAELAKHGLDKETMNYEALRDFAVMLNAACVTTDEVSLFSTMARHVSPHADAWFF